MPGATITLEALDGLFFRDGRPFGEGDRARSRLPMPQTLAGAVRTHALRSEGFDFRRLRRSSDATDPAEALLAAGAAAWAVELGVSGPLPALVDPDGALEPLLPAPANLFWADEAKERIVRADPLAGTPPGWRSREGLRPLWVRDARIGKPVTGYLRAQGASAWLGGGVPAAADIVEEAALFCRERRTGVTIDAASGTADEGLLYSVELLRPRSRLRVSGAGKRRVVFTALVTWPEGGPQPEALFGEPAAIPWGGEGRRAVVRLAPELVLPGHAAVAGRAAFWLLTPALFAERWRPDHAAGLVAAAVPGAVAVSGWDLLRGEPKPNRFAVAAGAVYYFDPAPGSAEVAGDDELRRQGWGLGVWGGWSHA